MILKERNHQEVEMVGAVGQVQEPAGGRGDRRRGKGGKPAAADRAVAGFKAVDEGRGGAGRAARLAAAGGRGRREGFARGRTAGVSATGTN